MEENLGHLDTCRSFVTKWDFKVIGTVVVDWTQVAQIGFKVKYMKCEELHGYLSVSLFFQRGLYSLELGNYLRCDKGVAK
jgi:hypothetical protein